MKLKKITALMLASALLLATAACDNGGGENNGENTSTAPEQTGSQTSVESGEETNAPSKLPENTEEPPPSNVTDLNDYSYADGTADAPYSLDGTITDRMIALSELNKGNQVRLASVMKKAGEGNDITVAYIGGSITQGVSGGDNGCYAKLVTNWFESTFSNSKINYVRAGIGATGSYIGVHRADRDVISQKPDIVFVEFSVNDTTENTRRDVDSYDSLLRKLWNSESKPAVVCIGMTQENGTSVQNYHYDVAKNYDLPFISYRNAILDVIKNGHIKWKDISDDNIHPNAAGHKVLSELIIHYLESVNSSKDDISGDESDFSSAYTKDHYSEASLITPANFEAFDETGNFKCIPDATFGNFTGYWLLRKQGGFNGAKLVFKDVEAKNFGLLFGKTTKAGTVLDVYVDGELAANIDTRFPGGWGNYAEAAKIVSFEEKGKHTIEIVPQDMEDASMITICGLLIS